jgi:hypothetical protein
LNYIIFLREAIVHGWAGAVLDRMKFKAGTTIKTTFLHDHAMSSPDFKCIEYSTWTSAVIANHDRYSLVC